MFKPKSLKSILKPFNKMVTDLEAYIQDQDAKGNAAADKADDLLAQSNAHFSEADKARESLNVISAIIPKEK